MINDRIASHLKPPSFPIATDVVVPMSDMFSADMNRSLIVSICHVL